MKSLFPKYLAWIAKVPSLTKRGYFSLFPRKGVNENVIQYILRQFYVSDDAGTPSLTVTILFFVMIIVAVVTAVECKFALSMIYVYNSVGQPIKAQMQGFSVSFISLIVSLSVVITTFYHNRQKRHNAVSKEDQDDNDAKDTVTSKGMVDQVRGYIESVVGTSKSPQDGPQGK